MYRYFRVVLGGGRSGGRKESEVGRKGDYIILLFSFIGHLTSGQRISQWGGWTSLFRKRIKSHRNWTWQRPQGDGAIRGGSGYSTGSFSRQGLCRERRHWTSSWYRTESVYPTGCGLFFHYLVLGSSPGISHLLGRWWTCTAWWGEWLADAVVELATAVLPAFPPHWGCCGAGREWSEQLCIGPFQSWRCACWCGGPKTLET